MAYELIYTSVVKGLRMGSTGFCTVAMTDGMPPALISKLESLTGYVYLYPHYDNRYSQNPPSFLHYKLSIGSSDFDILGRICSCSPDYTGRSNKLAHFIVLSPSERQLIQAGPAAFKENSGIFRNDWNEPPHVLGAIKDIPSVNSQLRIASLWKQYTGDAGWAAIMPQKFMEKPNSKTYVIFDPERHNNLLELVDESIMLLPENLRWKVTFNTYMSAIPAGIQCNWIFCPNTQDGKRMASINPDAFIIDLTTQLPSAGEGDLQNIARTGHAVEAPRSATNTQINSVNNNDIFDQDKNDQDKNKEEKWLDELYSEPPKKTLQLENTYNDSTQNTVSAPTAFNSPNRSNLFIKSTNNNIQYNNDTIRQNAKTYSAPHVRNNRLFVLIFIAITMLLTIIACIFIANIPWKNILSSKDLPKKKESLESLHKENEMLRKEIESQRKEIESQRKENESLRQRLKKINDNVHDGFDNFGNSVSNPGTDTSREMERNSNTPDASKTDEKTLPKNTVDSPVIEQNTDIGTTSTTSDRKADEKITTTQQSNDVGTTSKTSSTKSPKFGTSSIETLKETGQNQGKTPPVTPAKTSGNKNNDTQNKK